MLGRRRYFASNSDALGSGRSGVWSMSMLFVERGSVNPPSISSYYLPPPAAACYSGYLGVPLIPVFRPPVYATIIVMGSVTGAKPAKVPFPVLCVDLDGPLIRGNVLWECILVLLKTHPIALLLLPVWLLAGRASLKRHLAARTHPNPARLPYRQQVLELIQQEKANGRRIALVTAADRALAEAIASYLGLFDEVHASDGQLNLKGANKAAFLAQHFAETGFEYVGDSAADVEVWRNARAAYVVGTEARAEQAAAVTTLKGTILESRASLRASFLMWIDALRGHHWAKNLLLFLPLALSHNLAAEPIVRTLAGFALYGLCASGLYILNDLLDLHSDREHPWKRERPFAAGDISISQGLLASFILLSAALGLGFLLNAKFGFALLGSAALTMLYSLYLKKVALFDVFVLSSFYSFRILAGALISATPLSQWFLAFSMYFFFPLSQEDCSSRCLRSFQFLMFPHSRRGSDFGPAILAVVPGVLDVFLS